MNKSILIMIIITFTLFCGCSETQKIPIDTDTTAMNNSDSTENEQSTPPEIDDKSRDILINNAGALTSHFIHFSVPSYMIENEISIGETEIWRFLMTTFATKNNPYASYCQYTDDGIAKPL